MSKQLTIPTHFSAITLRQYIDWHAAENQVQKLAAALSCEVAEVLKIKANDAAALIDAFEIVVQNETNKHAKTITLDSQKLGFFPKIESMSSGEYIGLDMHNKDLAETKNLEKLVDMMAIMYRPVTFQVGDHYEVEDYDHKKSEARKKLIGQLPMEVVNGALLFFSTLGNELLIDSQKFLSQILNE